MSKTNGHLKIPLTNEEKLKAYEYGIRHLQSAIENFEDSKYEEGQPWLGELIDRMLKLKENYQFLKGK